MQFKTGLVFSNGKIDGRRLITRRFNPRLVGGFDEINTYIKPAKYVTTRDVLHRQSSYQTEILINSDFYYDIQENFDN